MFKTMLNSLEKPLEWLTEILGFTPSTKNPATSAYHDGVCSCDWTCFMPYMPYKANIWQNAQVLRHITQRSNKNNCQYNSIFNDDKSSS